MRTAARFKAPPGVTNDAASGFRASCPAVGAGRYLTGCYSTRMSMDLLPLPSPARRAPAPAAAEGHTLTLQLRTALGAMSGRLAVREQLVAAPDAVHVRVALPAQTPLTLTL
jgi:hypothetical protein